MKAPRASLAPVPALLVLLCGCTVGPDYRGPPALAAADSFESTAAAATTRPGGAGASRLTASPVAAARWWRTLRDPLLDALMDQAVASNLDVRIAAARVRQARAELAYAAGGRYPQVGAGAAYAHDRLSKTAAPYNAFDVPGFPWEYDQYQAGFDASWELDVFGGVRRGVEAAGAELAAREADRRGALLSVMAEVARNYVDLRGLQRREAIARRNLRSQRETLELTQDRRRQGLVTELDVAQAASQVAKTGAQLPLLRRRRAEAARRIAVLLGRPPEALADELAAPRPVPVPPPEVAVGVPAELLRRRPDVRRAERELAAATARVGQATADLYPRFSLSGNFAVVSADTNNLFDWNSRSFGVGPTVTWPVLDAGRLRRVVDVRTAQQEQALAQYERTVLGALEEAHDAIAAFVSEQERRRALADAAAADRTAAEVAEAQYRQGVVDFLHVLDAQRSLYESEDRLADADRAVTTALVALYKALAGGWEPAPPPPPPPPAEQAAASLH